MTQCFLINGGDWIFYSPEPVEKIQQQILCPNRNHVKLYHHDLRTYHRTLHKVCRLPPGCWKLLLVTSTLRPPGGALLRHSVCVCSPL